MRENEKVGSIHKRPQETNLWRKRSWDERIAQHFKAHELPRVAKERIEGHEVYIGVSDEKLHDAPKAYPSGYYKTAFAVKRGKTVPVQILEFDGNHNPELNERDKLRARVNKTIEEACYAIKVGKEGGFYE